MRCHEKQISGEGRTEGFERRGDMGVCRKPNCMENLRDALVRQNSSRTNDFGCDGFGFPLPASCRSASRMANPWS